MGRPNKKGLEFIPIEVNIFDDIKIKKLIRKSDGRAFSVFQYILVAIYKDGYYIRVDEDLIFFISDALKYDEDYIKSVIDDCIDLGLFNKCYYDSDRILTSKGIQERYIHVMNLCRRILVMDEYIVRNGNKPQIIVEEKEAIVEETPEIVIESTQRKETKEIKEKGINDLRDYIEIYNHITGSIFSMLNVKFSKENFDSLLNQGYGKEDFENAICNAVKDDFIRMKRLTPEWLIRPENFEKYCQNGSEKKEVKRVEVNENPDGKRKLVKAQFKLPIKSIQS